MYLLGCICLKKVDRFTKVETSKRLVIDDTRIYRIQLILECCSLRQYKNSCKNYKVSKTVKLKSALKY